MSINYALYNFLVVNYVANLDFSIIFAIFMFFLNRFYIYLKNKYGIVCSMINHLGTNLAIAYSTVYVIISIRNNKMKKYIDSNNG